MKKINPFLWFDSEEEEAAKFHVGIFKNSKIGKIARYGEEAAQKTGRPAGSVMICFGSDLEVPIWYLNFFSINALKEFYGGHWWMRLRRDTIRVEESAVGIGRLSLYRLPTKRWRALCAMGIGAA